MRRKDKSSRGRHRQRQQVTRLYLYFPDVFTLATEPAVVLLSVMPWHVLSVLKVDTLLSDAAFSGDNRAVSPDALFGVI